MPNHPFLLSAVAPRNSGKTNVTVDSLIDKNKFRGKFDEIIIWSKTFRLDPKWSKVSIDDDNVFTEWDVNQARNILLDLIEDAEERQRAHKPLRKVLLIFDDMLSENIMNKQQAGPMEEIAAAGRHSGVSCIIIYQAYKSISPIVRTNTTNLIMFRIKNAAELKKICDENRESLTSDEWMQVYNYCTGDPYCFLHINNQEQDPKKRFRKNWGTILELKNID